MPDTFVIALTIEGFWSDEANPFGPVQLYVAPATIEAYKFNVLPAQIGPLLDAVGADGRGLTVAVVMAGAEVQPAATVTVTA